jgi:hypothetical protein
MHKQERPLEHEARGRPRRQEPVTPGSPQGHATHHGPGVKHNLDEQQAAQQPRLAGQS